MDHLVIVRFPVGGVYGRHSSREAAIEAAALEARKFIKALGGKIAEKSIRAGLYQTDADVWWDHSNVYVEGADEVVPLQSVIHFDLKTGRELKTLDELVA